MNWIKSNPLIVTCMLVILLSFGVFYWTYRQSAAFREEMASRQQQLSRLEQLQSTTVAVPPRQIDAASTELRTVVNDATIDKLETVYQQLGGEYTNIYQSATRFNQYGHEVMLDGLFPQPDNQAIPYEARQEYLRSFADLYAELDAGTPPSAREMEELMIQQEDSFVVGNDSRETEEQREELRRRQADELVKRYRNTAMEYHVYADPVLVNDRYSNWEDPGIFQIGEWARPSGPKPSMFDIWEGQMQLWIQQDLVTAVALANEVDDESQSLVNLPIKRILEMGVEPGYIGVPPQGAFEEAPEDVNFDTVVSEIQSAKADRIPDDFTDSPTGRASNPIYDVRHAELSLIADSRQIPKILNAISNVNFMTVIGIDMSEVDEYEAMREGYYYGPTDVVQLDLDIETVWLRSWTAGNLTEETAEEDGEEFYAGLMPDIVRFHVGLPPRAPDSPEFQEAYEAFQSSGRRGGRGGTEGMGGMEDYGRMMQEQMMMQQQMMQQRGRGR